MSARPAAPLAFSLALLVLGSPAALAQEAPGESPGAGPTMFGLSCGLIAAVVLGIWLFQAFCIYWGALAAGIGGSFGRAMLVILASVLTSLPFAFVVLLLMLADSSLYASSPVMLSAGVMLGAQTLAFKWVYGTTWGRALLGFLVSSLLSSGIVAAVLIAVF